MDEKQRLIMEVVNAEKIEALNLLLADEKKALKDLADQLNRGVISQQQFAAAAAPIATNAVLWSKSIRDLEKETKNLGQAALQTSYAFQDFAQGGIGGVLNNIPGIIQSLGGGAGLAGIISGIGVAAYVATPLVKSLWKSFTDGPNALPATADALERTNERLKEAREALDKLKTGWDGSSTSLAEYNRLTAESADLEREANKEREKAAAIESQRKKERQGDAESAKAVSEAVKAAGGVDAVTAKVASARPGAANAAQAQLDQVKREQAAELAAASPRMKAGVNAKYGPQIAAAQATADKARSEANAGAADLVSKALQGDQASIKDLDMAVPDRNFGSATKKGLEARKKAEESIADTLQDIAGSFKVAKKAFDTDFKETEKTNANAEALRRSGENRENIAIELNRRNVAKQASEEQDRRNAILDTFNASQGRDQVDSAISEMERAANGGFTSDETQQLAASNQATFRADRGQASPDELQKIISQNDAMMRSLGDAGGDGSAMMSSFMQVQQQLLWALGRIQQQEAQNNQWRQMQPINGTLLSRGGG